MFLSLSSLKAKLVGIVRFEFERGRHFEGKLEGKSMNVYFLSKQYRFNNDFHSFLTKFRNIRSFAR